MSQDLQDAMRRLRESSEAAARALSQPPAAPAQPAAAEGGLTEQDVLRIFDQHKAAAEQQEREAAEQQRRAANPELYALQDKFNAGTADAREKIRLGILQQQQAAPAVELDQAGQALQQGFAERKNSPQQNIRLGLMLQPPHRRTGIDWGDHERDNRPPPAA